MKSNFSNLTIATALLIVAFACGKKDKATELKELQAQKAELEVQIAKLEKEVALSKDPKEIIAAKVIEVGVLNIESKPFEHYLNVQGKVGSDLNINVSAKVPSTFVKIYVKKGQSVSKGQILAQLDGEALRKGIQEAKTSLGFVTELYNKQKSLWDQKIGTEVQFLQAKNQKESLESKIEGLNEQLAMYTIKAPNTGIIDEVIAKEGEMAAPGYPAFRIINNSSFKVTADIAETYINKIKKGNKVQITFPDLNETIERNIDLVSDEINAINRTFSIQIELGASNKYKSNMITYFKIKDYSNPNAITVPINIIQHGTDGEYVFVAENGIARKRIISVGEQYGTEAEVTSGLKNGDKIINVGYQNIADGQKIKF
ncbi:MAG: cation efflux system protein/acriflavin resistance protein family [Bacteroidota bacterium]|jgi:RND family efflux transporter MFP subunit